MIKLITKTQKAYSEENFNYNTEKWENIKHEEQNYFTIVSNTKAKAEKLYDEINKIFECSLCPDYEEENSNYDNNYTISDTTTLKIDRRNLRKFL